MVNWRDLRSAAKTYRIREQFRPHSKKKTRITRKKKQRKMTLLCQNYQATLHKKDTQQK